MNLTVSDCHGLHRDLNLPNRFYFFSREEPRSHVHVEHADGEAKFWLEPEVALAHNYGLSARQVSKVLTLVRKHKNEIRAAWKAHFQG